MTLERDKIETCQKIVVTLDICSSTHLIEDLLKTEHIKLWRDLLIGMKEYLADQVGSAGLIPYKFTGDGWILLAEHSYPGKTLFRVLSGINNNFEDRYTSEIADYLDVRPDIYGLTFGLDEGTLIELIMNDKQEFIGRPINVSCRLQSKIDPVDIKGGFRGLMSNRLYNLLIKPSADELGEYNFKATTLPLKNLSDGGRLACYRFAIPTNKFRITEVRYGSNANSIDVTHQYIEKVRNDRLDIVISNEIAGNDPDPGVQKNLRIIYFYDGKRFEREFKENARIQLP